MPSIIFLVFRRIRTPIIVLILVYAISTLGLVLIPGMDDQGRVWHMDFFHAFYFVSFMGSTIGFGEIPYPFTDAQRMWTLFCIYATVVVWLYAIGTMLTLIQNPSFRLAVTRHAFCRSVRRIKEPFYIVCGYGDSGASLVRALVRHGIRCTVVENNQDRLNLLELEDLGLYVPGLNADANHPESLIDAGLKSRYCVGVIALTDADHLNLQIAITTKLSNSELTVFSRADTRDEAANIASFGTDHIINPFDIFAEGLSLAIRSPAMSLLREWLTQPGKDSIANPVLPPAGRWILCGYGRFGKAIHEALSRENIDITVIEADTSMANLPAGTIVGRGTEADTLREAKIETAEAIVAGTSDDPNNLSIVLTAEDLNPRVFMVARQNKEENGINFRAARLDILMHRSEIIARRIVTLISSPMVAEFLQLAAKENDQWANAVIRQISLLVNTRAPLVWSLNIDHRQAPAVIHLLEQEQTVRLGDISRNPQDRQSHYPCLALFLKRGGASILIPKENTKLVRGDRLLFCGASLGRHMLRNCLSDESMYYMATGQTLVTSWLLTKFFQWRRGTAPR